MWLTIFLMFVITLAGLYTGHNTIFQFQKLNKSNILNSILIVLVFFTVLISLHNLGYFPQAVAAPFMMGLYSFIAGFFPGYAWRIYQLKTCSGKIIYQHRSFWVDHAPNLLAVALIFYGIYRTSVFLDAPVTGIRLTSGISLISFGLYTWTLKAVPEFRTKGILFLDTLIPWEYVVSWNWVSETTLTIEYLNSNKKQKGMDRRLKEFSTFIPDEDKKEIENVLKDKTEEFSDIRKKIMLPDSDE